MGGTRLSPRLEAAIDDCPVPAAVVALDSRRVRAFLNVGSVKRMVCALRGVVVLWRDARGTAAEGRIGTCLAAVGSGERECEADRCRCQHVGALLSRGFFASSGTPKTCVVGRGWERVVLLAVARLRYASSGLASSSPAGDRRSWLVEACLGLREREKETK